MSLLETCVYRNVQMSVILFNFSGVNVQHTGVQSSIVEALIQHHEWFFPGGKWL